MPPSQGAIMTFRGTLAEVLAHQSEIPADSLVEINVYSPSFGSQETSLADDLAGLIDEAARVKRGEPITYTSPQDLVIAKALRDKFAKQGFTK